MGKDKVIIYVPKDFHKDILKNFRGKQVKVTLEEAVWVQLHISIVEWQFPMLEDYCCDFWL